MDDTVLQCFVVATSLVSAVSAVLMFTQSGWKNTIRATLLVLGAGGLSYFVVIPQNDAAVDRSEGGPVRSPAADQASRGVGSPPEPSPTAFIPSPAASVRGGPTSPPAYRRSAAAEVLPPAMSFVSPAQPTISSAARSAASDAPAWSSARVSFLGLAGEPKPLPYRHPAIYSPSEVLQCPRCGSPYSSSESGRGVKCPACSAIVDLVPPGRYFTIHCRCGNWIKSPFRYSEPETDGTRLQIPYYCPRCRSQGTLMRSTAGWN